MIHVQRWTGTGSVRITDMENAGKRGKVCKVIRFSGWLTGGGEPGTPAAQARTLALNVLEWADGQDLARPFEDAARWLREIVATAKLPAHCGEIHEDEIRGVDAPREKLTAGIPEVWSGYADEDGVSLSDHTDRYNEPRSATHGQSHARAYDIARKVWDEVRGAKSMHEADRILSAAGCRLHSWCAVD